MATDNAYGATAYEILFNDLINSKYSKTFKDKRSLLKLEETKQVLSEDQYKQSVEQAKALFNFFENNFEKKHDIEKALWLGSNDSHKEFVDISAKECPADTLILFESGDKFGISLKAAKRGSNKTLGNYGYANFFKTLFMHDTIDFINDTQIKVINNIPQLTGLSAQQRKQVARSNKDIESQLIYHGNMIIKSVRDSVIDKLQQLDEKFLVDFFCNNLLNQQGFKQLNYTIYECQGGNVREHDVMERIRNTHVGNFCFQKCGNTTVGVLSNNVRLFKIEFKYRSMKLCSSFTVKINRWD